MRTTSAGQRIAASLFVVLVLALSVMILGQAHARDAQQATVIVSPQAFTVPSVGSAFSVNVSIQDVNNLYGWEFTLYYPNAVLNGTMVTEGPFLKVGGERTFFLVSDFADNYSQTQGHVSVLCLRINADALGVDGNGVLATITFNSTRNNGPEALHLAEVKLSDPNATQIPCTTADGEVTIVPELSTALILPLLMVCTLTATAFRKRIVNHRGIFHTA